VEQGVAEGPVLSVLVPTYNYGDFIEDAIRSVLSQAVARVEIIVVDDGSTDFTQAMLAPLLSDRLRYFRQSNAGPSAARNLAIAHAQGRYLMFLDADDVLLPGCLAATMDFLYRHPQIGFFFTNYDIFDDEGVVSSSGVDGWRVFRTIPHESVADGEWIFSCSLAPWIVRYGGFMHTSGVTLQRSVALTAGPFRVGFAYGEDDDFWARVAYRTPAGYVDRVLSRKRNHPRSLIHDRRNTLQNAEHLHRLTELQLQDYLGDAEMQAILRAKLRHAAVDLGWELLESGQRNAAREHLRRSLARDPFNWSLYKLWLRSLLRAS